MDELLYYKLLIVLLYEIEEYSSNKYFVHA